MSVQHLSLIISVLAFIVSFWTRIESYAINQRQLRSERSKKVGEALVAAQTLKNELSDCQDILKTYLEVAKSSNKDESIIISIQERIKSVDDDYKVVWDLIASFEKIASGFERGGSVGIDAAAIEAKVARFNQRRVLAEFDIRWVTNNIDRINKAHDTLEQGKIIQKGET